MSGPVSKLTVHPKHCNVSPLCCGVPVAWIDVTTAHPVIDALPPGNAALGHVAGSSRKKRISSPPPCARAGKRLNVTAATAIIEAANKSVILLALVANTPFGPGCPADLVHACDILRFARRSPSFV